MDDQTAQPGSIVHVDLHTPDPDATAAFYEALLGWRWEPAHEGHGTVQTPAPPHASVAAFAERPTERTPSTLVHILVEDLAATKEAIEAAGGRVLAEHRAQEGSRFTVFEAPGGIVQAIREPSSDTGSGPRVPPASPPVGSIVHIEMHSEQEAATRRFYEMVFGWTFDELEETGYHVATMPNPPDGGCFARQEGPFEPPATLVYLLVDDVETALDGVRQAGGKVIGERYEIEGFGAFGIFEAPGGIVQAVWERASGPDVLA